MKFYHLGLYLVAAFVLGACNTGVPTDQSASSPVGTSTRACSGCWVFMGSAKTAFYQNDPLGNEGLTIGHPLLTMNDTTPIAMWDEIDPLYSDSSCHVLHTRSSKLVGNVWSENSVPQFPACGKRRALAPALKSPTTGGNMLFYDNKVVVGGLSLWTQFGTPVPMSGLGFEALDTDKTNESNGYAVAQTRQGIPTVAFSAYFLSDPARTSKIFVYRWQNNTWVNLGKKPDGSFDNGDNPKLVLRSGGSPVIAYRRTAFGGAYTIVVSRLNSANVQITSNINSKTMFVYPDFALVLDDNEIPIVASSESPPNTGNTVLMVRSMDNNNVVKVLGGTPLETAGVGLSYKPFLIFFGSTAWVAYRFNSLFVKSWVSASDIWKPVGDPIAPTSMTGFSTSIDTPQIVVQPNQNLLVMFNQENRQRFFGNLTNIYTELKVYSLTP
jgi:hypothetical protein